jgi:hypothetical protein
MLGSGYLLRKADYDLPVLMWHNVFSFAKHHTLRC